MFCWHDLRHLPATCRAISANASAVCKGNLLRQDDCSCDCSPSYFQCLSEQYEGGRSGVVAFDWAGFLTRCWDIYVTLSLEYTHHAITRSLAVQELLTPRFGATTSCTCTCVVNAGAKMNPTRLPFSFHGTHRPWHWEHLYAPEGLGWWAQSISLVPVISSYWDVWKRGKWLEGHAGRSDMWIEVGVKELCKMFLFELINVEQFLIGESREKGGLKASQGNTLLRFVTLHEILRAIQHMQLFPHMMIICLEM